MAEHRYSKEELLQLFCEDPMRPPEMPILLPITRDNTLIPLAFMPLSEDEQVRRYAVTMCRWTDGIWTSRVTLIECM